MGLTKKSEFEKSENLGGLFLFTGILSNRLGYAAFFGCWRCSFLKLCAIEMIVISVFTF